KRPVRRAVRLAWMGPDFEDIFAGAGCAGSIHAVRLVDGAELGHDPDRTSVSASVVKVPIGLAFYAEADSGVIDPARQVVIDSTNRTFGATGLSRFQDPATVSLRDLAYLMLTISDNAATEIIRSTVGRDTINRRLAGIGCHATVVVDFRALLDGVAAELGFADYPELLVAQRGELGPDAQARSTDQDKIDACRALDPDQTNRTTARDSTRLLAAVWSDKAASPAACANLRSTMAEQVTRRFLRVVPPGGKLAAKSGALFGRVTNEIGVVTYSDGGAFAVAVFTRAEAPFQNQPRINAAMAQAAALAVERLHSG
ncbi:MAG: serine hydrolase, partial [Acidimicrobiales bacterium]